MSSPDRPKAPEKDRCPHDHVEDRTHAELRESAYRRGFEQGYHLAMELMLKTGRTYRLQDHAEQVSDWRYRLGEFECDDRSKVRYPPYPRELMAGYDPESDDQS